MKQVRRYYLWNIGCQMNRADAYRLGEELEGRGYRPTRVPKLADILVLNTCVVRQSAERKVLGRLSSLSRAKRSPGDRVLLVMGCFVDDADSLKTRYPFVDAFFAPSDVAGLVEFVDRWAQEREATGPALLEPGRASRVAELVPVSHGCDRGCTYCIVRLRRGRQRSKPIPQILAEAKRLVRGGAREITLLGQNVDAYGSDLPDDCDLTDVFRAVHGLEDLWRIRFLTSHPRDMTQPIIDAVAELPKVCECWELPLQSGDDSVLRRMRRGYGVDRFRELIGRVRRATPRCAIGTDVIVGFSGETREQFEHTLCLLREIRFDVVHVAKYSVRPGTPAARWDDDVGPEEKERRRTLVEEVQREIATRINAAWLGEEAEVLVDGQQRGRWRGRTRTNKLVFFESEEDWLGRMARVLVTRTGPWSMSGQVVRS